MAALTSRGLAAAVALVMAAGPASAQISLTLVNSYARTGPFGLAFDGTNIWYSNNAGMAFEMSTGGVNTGLTTTMPGGWSELGWDVSRNQLVSKGNGATNVVWYDRYTAGNQVAVAAPAVAGFSLIDGIDVDNGELWYSPDVGNVYRFLINYVGGVPTSFTAAPGGNPFLGGAGGYSGVERVTIGATSYVFVVNDALNPRRLCVHRLDATLVGCENFVNQRYEGLAFDGRYLWAADYFGNKIDKFDVLDNGASILLPDVPEPTTVVLTATGLLALLAAARRRARA